MLDGTVDEAGTAVLRVEAVHMLSGVQLRYPPGYAVRVTARVMTTIKVPKELRERVAVGAAEQGLTAAELIASLLDERERQARFRSVRACYATTDEGYAAETAEWDALAGEVPE